MTINLLTNSGTGSNVGSVQLSTVSRTSTTPVAMNPVQIGATTIAPITSPNDGSAGATTDTKIDTFIIGTSTYSFMRPKAITFTVRGLKPNTEYFPFFNNVYVGDFCSTKDNLKTSDIRTNALGEVTGIFYLPGNLFPCGTHTFKLVDHYVEQSRVENGISVTARVADPLYGQVEAVYESSGILKQQQTQITSTSTIDLVTLQPVNITLSTIFAASTPPGITAPTATVCERWYFEYEVTSVSTKTFSVTTMTSTAPTSPSPNVGASGTSNATSIVYLNTSSDGSGRYTHTYSYRFTTVTTYHQDWVGRVTDLVNGLPPITLDSSWRPSGISSNDAVKILNNGWKKQGVVACPAALQIPTQIRPVDPLAQSFFVDALLSPRGVFITSVSVYFKTVDQSTPVLLELRNMVNGLPGSAILPGGRVVLPGYAAGQSNNATIATTFAFDQPIFLQANKEYCFVLKSSSIGYNAWCSRLGGTDVTTGKIIDTQPYLGTLFKSENDSTWIPDSYEDLKFDLNVAVFDISKTGLTTFRPMQIVLNNNNYYADLGQVLPLSYISTTYNEKSLKIKIPMHGLQKNDVIFITGLATVSDNNPLYYNGIPATALANKEFMIDSIIDEDTVNITVGGNVPANMSGPIMVGDVFGSIDPILSPLPPATYIKVAEPVLNTDTNSPVTIPDVPKIEVANCQSDTDRTIISANVFDPKLISIGSPVFGKGIAPNAKVVSINTVDNKVVVDKSHVGEVSDTITFIYTAPPPRPTPLNVTSSTTFTVFVNALVNEGMIDYLSTEMDGTNINEHVSIAKSSYAYSLQEQVEKDGRFHEFSEPRLITNPNNEILHSGELNNKRSLELNLELSSSDKNVSPVIDTNGMTFTIRSYKIDNQSEEINNIFNTSDSLLWKSMLNDYEYNSEIVPGQGLANAKYKGPVIQTTTDYKGISLFVTGNCPNPAIFDVYIRTSSDADTHMDQNWEWMPYKGDYLFNHADNFPYSINKLVVNEWLFEYKSDAYFNVYDIKVVMRTTNNSIVPKIFGLRTITHT